MKKFIKIKFEDDGKKSKNNVSFQRIIELLKKNERQFKFQFEISRYFQNDSL